MRLILAALAGLIIAGPAAAQTTTCGWELGRWVCRTRQPPPNIVQQGQDAFDRAYERGQQMQRDREAALQARAAAEQQEEAGRHEAHVQRVQQLVADAIREHRCADAKDLALQEGDLTLADQAQRLCN
jgi:hypothetical protein